MSAKQYFISHTPVLINNHLTYQDEDFALQILNLMDALKVSNDYTICDSAFEADKGIKYNI